MNIKMGVVLFIVVGEREQTTAKKIRIDYSYEIGKDLTITYVQLYQLLSCVAYIGTQHNLGAFRDN